MSSIVPIAKTVAKVVPKTKKGKAAAVVAGALGINLANGDSSKDKPTAMTPSQDALNAEKNVPQGGTTGKTTLVGLPKDTLIKTGVEQGTLNADRPFATTGLTPTFSKATYVEGDAERLFATKNNQQKAELLLRMGQIPGLYGAGEAPTPDYITNAAASGAIIPRSEDITAFKKILAATDLRGGTPDETVLSFVANPKLATQFFGKVSGGTGKAVTPYAQLEAEMNAKFQDLFNVVPDKAMIKAYAKDINKLEAGTGISAQQKEDIFLKYTQKKANDLYSMSEVTGDKTALQQGTLGKYVQGIRSAYAKNGIPINEKDVYAKAIASMRSKEAYDNEVNTIRMNASTLMPAFKDMFAQGQNARQILSPYITMRSKIYGIPEDQIKVEDMYEVGSGQVAMTAQEYKSKLYASDEFKKTDAYKERSLGDLQAMLRAFKIG
jgi:hypothetical protein